MFKPGILIVIGMAVLAVGVLNAAVYSGGDGSAASPYQIAGAADVQTLSANSGDWGSYFVMTADINLTGLTFTQAVISPDGDNTNTTFEGTAFTGRFDGRGFKIQNLKIDTNFAYNDYLGLFGKLGAGAVVRNLTVESFVITGGQDSCYLGGLAGYNAGTVQNCRATGSISCRGDYTLCAGGLIGSNASVVEACSAAVALTIQDDSYATGGLVGENYPATAVIRKSFATGAVAAWTYSYYTGGLVGDNTFGNIYNSYATGNVTGTYGYLRQVGGLAGRNNGGVVQNSYSTGRVLAGNSNYVGGFLGYSSGGSNTGCFWDTTTSGQSGSAGGSGVVGKATADMKIRATFIAANWDFTNETAKGTNDYWRMCSDGVSYPALNWQNSRIGDFECPGGVGLEDLDKLSSDWLTSYTEPLSGADADGDGVESLSDFAVLADHWLSI